MYSPLHPRSVKSEPGTLHERAVASEASERNRSCSYPSGLEDVNDVMSKIMSERSFLASSYTKLKERNQALMTWKKQMEQNSKVLQMKLHDATVHIKELEANADVESSNKVRLNKLTDGVRHFIAETEKEMINYEHNVAELERAKGIAETNSHTLRSELIASKAKEEELASQLETIRVIKLSLEKDVEVLNASVLSKSQVIERISAEKEAQKEEQIRLTDREKNLRNEYEETRKALAVAFRENDVLRIEAQKAMEENRDLVDQCRDRLAKSASLENALKCSTNELHATVSELKALKEELSRTKEQNIRLSMESEHKDEIIAGLRQQLLDASKAEHILAKEIKFAQEQLSEQRQINSKLAVTTSQLEVLNREQQQQLRERDAERDDQREEVKMVRSSLTHAEHQLMLKGRDIAIMSQEMEKSCIEMTTKLKRLQEEVNTKDLQLRRMANSTASLESERSKTSGERSSLETELKIKEKELICLASKVEDYSQALIACKKTAQEYHEDNKALQKTLTELRTFMSEACNEVKRFKEENSTQIQINETLVKQLEALSGEHNETVWKMAEMKKQLLIAGEEIKATKTLHDSDQLHCNKLETNFKKVTQDAEALHQSLLVREGELKVKEGEVAKLQEGLRACKREHDLRVDEVAKGKTVIDDLHKRLTSLTIELEREKFQAKSLADKNEQHESEKLRLVGKLDSEKKAAKLLGNKDTILTGELMRSQEKARFLDIELRKTTEEKVVAEGHFKAVSIDLANTQKCLKESEQINNNQCIEITQLKKDLTEAKSQVNALQVASCGRTHDAHEFEGKRREWLHKIAELEDKVSGARLAEEKILLEKSSLANAVNTLKERVQTVQVACGDKEKALLELSAELKSSKANVFQLHEDNAKLRAMTRELQGIIDGSRYKESWILEREQINSNEAKTWRENTVRMEKRMLAYRDQLERIQLVHQKTVSDLENAKACLLRTEHKAELMQKDLQELISNLQNRCANAESQFHSLHQMTEQQIATISTHELKFAELTKVKEGLQTELMHVSNKLNDCKNQLCAVTEQLSQAHAEHQVDQAKINTSVCELRRAMQFLKDTQIERDHVRLMLATSEQDAKRLNCQLGPLEAEISRLKAENGELEQEKASAQRECETLKSKVKIFQFTDSARAQQQQDLEAKLKSTEDQLKKALNEASEAQVRLSSISGRHNEVEAASSFSPCASEQLIRQLQAMAVSTSPENVGGTTLHEMQRLLEELSADVEPKRDASQARQSKAPKMDSETRQPRARDRQRAQSFPASEEVWRESEQIHNSLMADMDSIQLEMQTRSSGLRY